MSASEIKIRLVFEAADLGEALTPDLADKKTRFSGRRRAAEVPTVASAAGLVPCSRLAGNP